MIARPAIWRASVLLALAAVVIIAVVKKPERELRPAPALPGPIASHAAGARSVTIPRLVDLGADTCIPCKAMAPILVELRTEYAGRMQVDFIDVWKNPGAGDPFNIYAIPTQIFFDGRGKELTRHEGFISRQDILATWKRYGFDFGPDGVPTPKS